MAKFANFFRRKLSTGKSKKLRLHRGYCRKSLVLTLFLIASTYALYWAFYQEHNFWEESKKLMATYFELNRQIYAMKFDTQMDGETMEFNYKNDERKDDQQREYKDFDGEWIDGTQPTKKFLQTENITVNRNISKMDEISHKDKSPGDEIHKDDHINVGD